MQNELVNYDLRINSAGVFESYRHGVWNPPQVFRDYDLLVFSSGVGTCLVNGQARTISPQDVILMRRGDRIQDPMSAGKMGNLLIHFDFLDEQANPTDPPQAILPPRFPANANSLVITDLMQSIMQMIGTQESDAACTVLRTILLLLAGRESTPPSNLSVQHRSRVMRELARRVLEDPAPQRLVANLADEAGMSTTLFTRTFRKETGHSPGEFMVLARIERAKLLLTTTSRTVADIADLLGYLDVYFFTRQFTRKTGMPPAAYRKALLARGKIEF